MSAGEQGAGDEQQTGSASNPLAEVAAGAQQALNAGGQAQQGLPPAEQALQEAEPPPVPITNLDPEQQQRANEAAVRRAGLRAEQAEDDRDARRLIVRWVVRAVAVQVVIADAVFIFYAHKNDWELSAGTMQVWLAAAVVQVIAVALVVVRSLFPPRR